MSYLLDPSAKRGRHYRVFGRGYTIVYEEIMPYGLTAFTDPPQYPKRRIAVLKTLPPQEFLQMLTRQAIEAVFPECPHHLLDAAGEFVGEVLHGEGYRKRTKRAAREFDRRDVIRHGISKVPGMKGYRGKNPIGDKKKHLRRKKK